VLDENPYNALGGAPKKEEDKKATNSKSKDKGADCI
jgi:hypothetical protein